VLHSVAVCCTVLLCVAVCGSVLQCILGHVHCSVRFVIAFMYVLQCVAVCCSALQCVAVRCSVLQCVERLHQESPVVNQMSPTMYQNSHMRDQKSPVVD